MSKIQLLSDRVLLKKVEEEKKEGSIILIDKPDENRWEVVNIGPEVTEVSEGQVVAIGSFTGEEMEIEKESFRLIREEEVIGIYE